MTWKFIFSISISKKCHSTRSKALLMSSFKAMYGEDLEWLSSMLWKISKAIVALSVINLSRRKTLWASSMTVFITFFKRFTKTSETILYGTLQRLIAWKNAIIVGFFILRTSNRWVWLIAYISSPLLSTFKAKSITSSPIIWQCLWKKQVYIPSVSEAFWGCICFRHKGPRP